MDSNDHTHSVLSAGHSLERKQICPIERATPLPVSFLQQRLWLAGQPRRSPNQCIKIRLRLRGKLNRRALLAALNRIVERHEILRTAYPSVEGNPEPLLGPADMGFSLIEEAPEAEERTDKVDSHAAVERFDVATGPLIRGRLSRVSEQEHVLIIAQHPLISDTWSTGLLMRELADLYRAFALGQSDPLPPLEIQYIDYAGWQRRQITDAMLKKQLAFWIQNLSNAELSGMPTDRNRPTLNHRKNNSIKFRLADELTRRLRELSQKHGVSPFITLLGGWAVLIGRWCGLDEVVIGTRIDDRPGGVESLIGPLQRTVALRVQLREAPTVEQLLRQIEATVEDSLKYQDVPFEQVTEALEAAIGHRPIFATAVTFRETPAAMIGLEEIQLPDLALEEIIVESSERQFDISLLLTERGGELIGTLDFTDDLFERATIERMASCWEELLRAMVRGTEKPLDQLPMMTEIARNQVIKEFNNTMVHHFRNKLIHELFEDQVERTPNGVAVEYERHSLSYAELNSRANRLARFLRARGVNADKPVGICVERSLEMVVGLLAILKAGGAYVPFDPSYPSERLQYMLRDSAPHVLLTQERLRATLPPHIAEVVSLDTDWGGIATFAGDNLVPSSLQLSPRNLAYVIYTSGSTGAPKGAMNDHRGVVNRLQWMQDQYGLDPRDRVLQKTPFSFDVSVWEFFWTLMSGARLIVARPQGHQDPAYLAQLVDEAEVTTLHFVPSMLQVFLDRHQPGSCKSIRHIVCSGEELSATLRNNCLKLLPEARLSNLYGPTEAAIDVTAWECQLTDSGSRVPIGRPISNTQMYLLDPRGQPVPIGVVGEIHIGGVGVGRGYFNRPELTAERFVANWFSEDSENRLYKTGDIGRWRIDGSIEFLGRNDQQVKLRGFRIELGEIEAQIASLSQVREAVVLAREDVSGDKRLVGYIVPTGRGLDEADDGSGAADELIQQWESIYDNSYESGNGGVEPTFAGWNSSYTGLPIPIEQMREWLEFTVARIRQCRPQKVLEIGCGVGLLVEKLAPECGVYHGTDLSAVAIRNLRRWVGTKQQLRHVEVSQRVATDLNWAAAGSFDTIILNSVVQHFPNVNYLLLVIERALTLVSPGGQIFIGDVRNRDLLEQFHGSVQLTKAVADMTTEQLRMRIRQAVEHEKQLVTSPEFFRLLPRRFPRITKVEVLIKRGRFENELTTFRYDVFLHVDRPYIGEPAEIERLYSGPRSVEQVEADLQRHRPATLRMSRIANRRLAYGNQILKIFETGNTLQRAEQLCETLGKTLPSGEDPETFWDLGERYGYLVELTSAHDSKQGQFDVQLTDATAVIDRGRIGRGIELPVTLENDLRKYCNDPMALKRRDRLVSRLREALKTRLPEHMIPNAFVILDAFPLTPNGKLDRRALPAPELGLYSTRQYDPPHGTVEEALTRIWQELLQVERVGRYDNFFELGGHSLLIVQMVERLRRLDLSADVRDVFESPTLADLATKLRSGPVGHLPTPPSLIPTGCDKIFPQMLPLVELDLDHIARIVQTVPGGAGNVQDIYPLAPLQEGILFHYLLNERGGDTYIMPTLISVSSREKLDDLIAALQGVIDRHDSLRSAVLWDQLPQPVQVVYRRATLPVENLPLDSQRDPVEQLKERMRPEQQRLDLRKAPLMRLQVAADPSGARWYALLQLHHMTGDHHSLEIMDDEVMSFLEQRAPQLPVPIPYRIHVAQALAYSRANNAEAFFRGKLRDVEDTTAPFGLSDVYGDGSQIEEDRTTLDATIAKGVRAQARRLGVTAAALFHAAWGLVVSNTAGRDDVVYGSVLLGRMQGTAGAQRIHGMFINTLPIRLRLRRISVRDLVEQTQRELVELLQYEQVPLAVAQRCSGIPGSTPLFTTLLNCMHSAPASLPERPGAELGIYMIARREWTNYPITISVDDRGDEFALMAQTDRRINPSRMMAYLQTAIRSLVEALERTPQAPALALSILPENERRQVIESYNPDPIPLRDLTIHELFEEQAERTPDAIAVLSGESRLTYAELNNRANRLARYLRSRGVGPDQLIAICVERGAEMFVGLLGILKSGAAYVPLDPVYPTDRLVKMLGDAAPRILLTLGQQRGRFPEAAAEVFALDDDWIQIDKECADNLDLGGLRGRANSLAYVIYTSGSTGQPKGVMVQHINVVNLWQGLDQVYGRLDACNRVALNASLNFDASVQQLVQLLSGRTVVVIPQSVRRDPAIFLNFIEEKRIAGIDCTPSQLKSWISAGLLVRGKQRLRVVLVGGEAIEPELWDCLANSPEINFHNVYGPTECTVDATIARIKNAIGAPHIGHPMRNRRVYILGSSGQPVPIGVPGEIHIGGAGVARGYLNQPELTADLFVPDQFSTERQARMYRSGDLGRWRPDGTIEFLGRNDKQVKVRGFRVELGEIEAQLERHPLVKQATVLAREDAPGEKRLVAYVIPCSQGGMEITPDVDTLRSYLRSVLPDYMVPGAFVVLERFPWTSSGKLDRRALPAPELGAYMIRQYEAPQGEVEEIVAGIWQGLLRLERVGREDNFLDLGGHSLLAMQVMVRIRSLLAVEISVSAIFRFPTLRQLSSQIESLRLLHRLDDAAKSDPDDLLQRVASMPESKVQELLQEFNMRGTS